MKLTPKWDKRFLEMATLVASWSKDPTTKVGCVIVSPEDKTIVSVGYNGFNSFALDEESLYDNISREEKRARTIHAEKNAIYNAAKIGASVVGCSLYVTHPCCSDCSLGIIQSGIKEIVYPKDSDLHSDWLSSIDRAEGLFKEARIIYRTS